MRRLAEQDREDRQQALRAISPLPEPLRKPAQHQPPRYASLTPAQLTKSFPNLLSFDISFNFFCGLDETVSGLIELKRLKMLMVTGNPMCLRRNYSTVITSQLLGLNSLDGTPIIKEEEKSKDREVNDINDLMGMLYAEDRLKQQALEAEKNKKGGAKDPAKDKKLPEAKKEAAKQPVKPIQSKLEPQPSMEFDPMNVAHFETTGLSHPFKMIFSVKTLEKVDGVFFDDIEGQERDKTMSCYWFDFSFSRPLIIRRQAPFDQR